MSLALGDVFGTSLQVPLSWDNVFGDDLGDFSGHVFGVSLRLFGQYAGMSFRDVFSGLAWGMLLRVSWAMSLGVGMSPEGVLEGCFGGGILLGMPWRGCTQRSVFGDVFADASWFFLFFGSSFWKGCRSRT